MDKKGLNTALNIAGIVLGTAGLVFILLSILTDKDTLKWGLMCVALGSILGIIRKRRNKPRR